MPTGGYSATKPGAATRPTLLAESARALGRLVAACAGVYACLGVSGGPATQLVALAALVLAVAPLFWPAGGGAALLAAWSGVLALGVVATAVVGFGVPGAQALRVGWVLAALLVATHACLGRAATDDGRLYLVGALVVLGSGPVWLGPLAALAGTPTVADAVLAASPLAHLAVAADADLLRTTWFYSHSLLGSTRFNYPTLGLVAGGDALLAAGGFTFALAAAAGRRRLRPATVATDPPVTAN